MRMLLSQACQKHDSCLLKEQLDKLFSVHNSTSHPRHIHVPSVYMQDMVALRTHAAEGRNIFGQFEQLPTTGD